MWSCNFTLNLLAAEIFVVLGIFTCNLCSLLGCVLLNLFVHNQQELNLVGSNVTGPLLIYNVKHAGE